MAITQAIANNFKKLLLEGDSNFSQSGGDKYKLALYTSSATLNSATTSFTTSNEVSSSNYSSGGGALVNNPTSITAGVARADFADLSFQNVTLTARGALIYNTSSFVQDMLSVKIEMKVAIANKFQFFHEFPHNSQKK